MIRATTGGVMKTYRSNLMNSFINMNANRNTVLSQRTFNSFAEDPAAAAKAFRLRKSRMTVESQYSICTDAKGKYQQAVSCLQSIDDVLCTKEGVYGQYMKTLTGTTLSMLNDPTGDAREQLTQVLDQMSQQIIQTMNQKYGDNFVFAGADGHNVPFEIKDNKLYYRGVPVDASMPDVLTDKDGNPIAVDADGNVITDLEAHDGPVYYLKADSVKAFSKDEYEKLYTVPDVQKFGDIAGNFDTDINDAPIEYNKDGTPKAADDDEGGYYRFSDGEDENGNTIYKLISIADYESYQDTDQPIEYNEDGTVRDSSDPDQKGGYYLRSAVNEDGVPTSEPMLIFEYDSIVTRVENAQYLQDTDGNNYDYALNEDGYPMIYVLNGDPQTMTKADYDQQKLDWEKLRYLANETQFVDIGYGFQEDPVTGKLIESSAFNIALNGINFIGWGLDEDGDPKNLYSLVQRMKEIANSVPSSTDWTDETWDKFDHLVDKFEDAVSRYQTDFADLDASSSKLKSQEELLMDNFDTLQEQYSDIEDVDMVDAITSFIWAEYCYNAALKVGNSILSESLMDYLR